MEIPALLKHVSIVSTDYGVIAGVVKAYDGIETCFTYMKSEPSIANGRKAMDKSCQWDGNFHTDNHGMIAGRRAYIAVLNLIFNIQSLAGGIAGSRMTDVD